MVRALVAFGAILSLVPAASAAPDAPSSFSKLDLVLSRLADPNGVVRVIVRATNVARVETLVAAAGGRCGRHLTGIGAIVAEIPARALRDLAAAPEVRSISVDRRLQGALDRTGDAIGARWVTASLGFDGSGIGVAIVDSGVTAVHDDLEGNRIVQFLDFVDAQPQPHDGYGHGTHVAGIIAGSGFDSDGARRGLAPGAHLVVLRALDAQGDGYVSNAIAAIDYAIDQRAAYNIRVINLSVAGGVYESYQTDPLALAARRAVEAGIVVVTAAGNLGRNASGRPSYGGITSPGNAPWVLTVGAADHKGTVDRADDSVAPFSSLGPTAIDGIAKPDLVAPGVGIESLADAGSTLFEARPLARLWGTVPTATPPYLSLSGTSMAAPVVAATVALMLEANPALTPAAVKMLLRASATRTGGGEPAAEGAGFLDARGAVELARAAAEYRDALPLAAMRAPGTGLLPTVGPCGNRACAFAPEPCATGDGCVSDGAAALTAAGTRDDAAMLVWPPAAEPPRQRRLRTGRGRGQRTRVHA